MRGNSRVKAVVARVQVAVTVLSFFVVSMAAGFYATIYLPAQRASRFASCRNHATFVGLALDNHLLRHGRFPHVPGLAGEDLFCRLNFGQVGQNCHAGAPGQFHGGWQMVNASPKSWDQIVRAMKGEAIPIIWCGRPHTPGGHYKGKVRIVIAIADYARGCDSLAHLIDECTDVYPDGERRLGSWRMIFYGMSDGELAAKLSVVNSILRRNGEAETPLDVTGRKDYWKIAKPYQGSLKDR